MLRGRGLRLTQAILVDGVVRLDGTATGPRRIVVGEDGNIRAVAAPAAGDGPALDRSGCTALPLLADAHVHLAISDGVTESPDLHRPEVVDAELGRYLRHGVGHVLSLGLDQPWLTEALQGRLADGAPRGGLAAGYSAGAGFGAVDGWPPEFTAPEPRFRPETPAAARGEVARLAERGVRALKIWVDDFGGAMPKIPHGVARAVVEAARAHGITSFAHVYFRDDAAELVDAGVDVLAHSIRDVRIDAALAGVIRDAGTTLVPTLVREELELAGARPGTAEEARLARNLDTAVANLRTCADAGVPVGLGTDSGFRGKTGGLAEHRELELMHGAGLSPASCLAAALGTNRRLFATALTGVEPGAPASFAVVRGDPLADIRATRDLVDVWARGERQEPAAT